MGGTVVDRLRAEQRLCFVGRASELELFRATLIAEELPFQVLFLYGLGGIGKTALLHAYELICAECATPAIFLDGREIEPTAEALLSALRKALGLRPSGALLDGMVERGGRRVVLIDSYDALSSLEGWLRNSVLPQLPIETLVVVASQVRPSDAWRFAAGWQRLLHPHPMAPLSAEESREYLARRQVPARACAAIQSFARGYPLALALAADLCIERGGMPIAPAAEPGLIRTLSEHLIAEPPSPAHRVALEACALVRRMTEPLLAAMLAVSDAHDLFTWLCHHSCIEAGPHGLAPHDFVRDIVASELHWRHPDRAWELPRRASAYYAEHVIRARGMDQVGLVADRDYLSHIHFNGADGADVVSTPATGSLTTVPGGQGNLVSDGAGKRRSDIADESVRNDVLGDRAAFDRSVLNALKGLANPTSLARNPLAYSCVVTLRAGDDAGLSQRAAALRVVLETAAATLRSAPRTAKFYRALKSAYFAPTGTREEAAAALDVASSTYFDHLKRGVALVAETVWQWEMSADADSEPWRAVEGWSKPGPREHDLESNVESCSR